MHQLLAELSGIFKEHDLFKTEISAKNKLKIWTLLNQLADKQEINIGEDLDFAYSRIKMAYRTISDPVFSQHPHIKKIKKNLYLYNQKIEENRMMRQSIQAGGLHIEEDNDARDPIVGVHDARISPIRQLGKKYLDEYLDIHLFSSPTEWLKNFKICIDLIKAKKPELEPYLDFLYQEEDALFTKHSMHIPGAINLVQAWILSQDVNHKLEENFLFSALENSMFAYKDMTYKFYPDCDYACHVGNEENIQTVVGVFARSILLEEEKPYDHHIANYIRQHYLALANVHPEDINETAIGLNVHVSYYAILKSREYLIHTKDKDFNKEAALNYVVNGLFEAFTPISDSWLFWNFFGNTVEEAKNKIKSLMAYLIENDLSNGRELKLKIDKKTITLEELETLFKAKIDEARICYNQVLDSWMKLKVQEEIIEIYPAVEDLLLTANHELEWCAKHYKITNGRIILQFLYHQNKTEYFIRLFNHEAFTPEHLMLSSKYGTIFHSMKNNYHRAVWFWSQFNIEKITPEVLKICIDSGTPIHDIFTDTTLLQHYHLNLCKFNQSNEGKMLNNFRNANLITPEVLQQADLKGQTIIHKAVRNPTILKIYLDLNVTSEVLSVRDTSNDTALALAVRTNAVDSLQLLLASDSVTQSTCRLGTSNISLIELALRCNNDTFVILCDSKKIDRKDIWEAYTNCLSEPEDLLPGENINLSFLTKDSIKFQDTEGGKTLLHRIHPEKVKLLVRSYLYTNTNEASTRIRLTVSTELLMVEDHNDQTGLSRLLADAPDIIPDLLLCNEVTNDMLDQRDFYWYCFTRGYLSTLLAQIIWKITSYLSSLDSILAVNIFRSEKKSDNLRLNSPLTREVITLRPKFEPGTGFKNHSV